MQFCSLTFVITEECNFRCSYCYQQKRFKFLDKSIIRNALDFFFPFLKEESYIHFYGGEPLLAFELIRQAVDCIRSLNIGAKKAIKYTISTNGSLLNDKILSFLSQHRFSILLSFDGLAQDISKQKGSFRRIVSNINKLLDTPDIELETNSVFTQRTIGYLTRSVQFINDLGVQKISYALSQISPWERSQVILLKKELVNLRRMMLTSYKNTGRIPLDNYKKKTSKGIFVCHAGRDRMDLTPDGKLWGCNFFADYFKGKEKTEEYAKYCFGDFHSFVKNHDTIYPKILMNYSNLRMDRYFTSDTRCVECSDLYSCGACPADNLFFSSDIRKVVWWECEIKKICRSNKMQFWNELESQM